MKSAFSRGGEKKVNIKHVQVTIKKKIDKNQNFSQDRTKTTNCHKKWERLDCWIQFTFHGIHVDVRTQNRCSFFCLSTSQRASVWSWNKKSKFVSDECRLGHTRSFTCTCTYTWWCEWRETVLAPKLKVRSASEVYRKARIVKDLSSTHDSCCLNPPRPLLQFPGI